MQRQQGEAGAAGERFALAECAVDLGCSGEEGEDVAGVAFGVEQRDSLADLRLQRLWRVRQMTHGERVLATCGAQDRAAAEIVRDRSGIERGGHDDEPQFGARALQALEQSEREVAVEVALVELVQHDGVDAAQGGVGEQATREDAFGDEAEARARAGDLVEADLVADGVADLLAEFGGDAARGEARGDAAWFEDEDFAADEGEQRGRDAGGLAGAGRGFEDEVGCTAERGENVGEDRIDRKGWLEAHCCDRNMRGCGASMRARGW